MTNKLSLCPKCRTLLTSKDEVHPCKEPNTLEAICWKCDETFVPADEMDTIHLVKADGTDCGGQGEITGNWGKSNTGRGRR